MIWAGFNRSCLRWAGWLYLKSDRANVRLMGRIILGIAFILISLQFLRDAVEPIRESAFLPAIAGYLESDYFSAFIVGAVLAFVMHSSVATILMCVTLVQIGAIPFAAGSVTGAGGQSGFGLYPDLADARPDGFSPGVFQWPTCCCGAVRRLRC